MQPSAAKCRLATRGQLAHTVGRRVRVGNPQEREVVRDGIAPQPGPVRRREQCLDLGGEQQRFPLLRVQRFDAEPVARETISPLVVSQIAKAKMPFSRSIIS